MKQWILTIARVTTCGLLFAIMPTVVFAEDDKPADASPAQAETQDSQPAANTESAAPEANAAEADDKDKAPAVQPEAPEQPEQKETPTPPAEPETPQQPEQPAAPQEAPAPAPEPEQQQQPETPTVAEDKPDAPKPPEQPAADPQWKTHLRKEHEAFFAWLEKNYSDKAEELKQVGNQQPDKFAQCMDEAIKVYEPIQKAERFPELAKVLRDDIELKSQRDDVLCKLCSAKDEQRDEYLKQLKEIVSARFDVIIQKKQLEYDHIRKRLDWLNKKLEQHGSELQKLKDEKDQSVEKRIQELIDGKVQIDW